MIAVSAGIFPAEKVLRFSGETIPLLDDDTYADCEYSELEVALTSEIVDEPDIDAEFDWEKTKVLTISTSSILDDEQMEKFKDFNLNIRDSFASNYEELGCCEVQRHKIKLIDTEPIHIRPYKKSESERLLINKEIELMLEAKIIRPSCSPWSAPVVMIPKKDKTRRMCIDYRRLNSVTIQNSWPLPRISDILDRLRESVWFSALDLKSGYWQVAMHPDSIELTAFSTADGHYEFLRVPFGLKTSPAELSRIMQIVFG